MKYMLCWRIPPASHKAAGTAFLDNGAPMPTGLTMVGRWHVPGSARGWVLVEGTDPVAVAEHVAEWSSLLEIDVHPVIEDDDAATAIGRVYG